MSGHIKTYQLLRTPVMASFKPKTLYINIFLPLALSPSLLLSISRLPAEQGEAERALRLILDLMKLSNVRTDVPPEVWQQPTSLQVCQCLVSCKHASLVNP